MQLPTVMFGQGFAGHLTFHQKPAINANTPNPAAVVEKKGDWIGDAFKDIKKRGTEGVCTGKKFGGPTCRPGTKRYQMAKNLHKVAHHHKKK